MEPPPQTETANTFILVKATLRANSAKRSVLGQAPSDAAPQLGQGDMPQKFPANAGGKEKNLSLHKHVGQTQRDSQQRSELALIGLGDKALGFVLRPHATPALPHSEEAVLAWSSFFSPGRTFSKNLAHREKARHFVGRDASRRARAVMAASSRLTTPRDQMSTPGPAVPDGQLFKLLTRKGWNSEFTLKVALGRNFFLRVQSGRLP